ncbi:MAG: hypothetical protein RBG13Loki_3521 [Promethearchaeota archaeon CR_4]|nr:MAG: hypothetical protein RBG13Loki_3521 [Candidatus Lokiarchaeota archaeon CR_4]
MPNHPLYHLNGLMVDIQVIGTCIKIVLKNPSKHPLAYRKFSTGAVCRHFIRHHRHCLLDWAYLLDGCRLILFVFFLYLYLNSFFALYMPSFL